MKLVSASSLIKREKGEEPDLRAYVQATLGLDGPFAKMFDGYQVREGQMVFSENVGTAIYNREILLAEAGTGSGKSFGALIPAIKSVIEAGGQVVYVTANIALQEQIIKKDLPALQKILGLDFTFGLAKGFNNFLCKREMEQSASDALWGKISFSNKENLDLLNKICEWNTETGDVSDFATEIPPEVKHLVTIQSDDCSRKKCKHFLTCYPIKAKKKYMGCDVIVTNYHMYFLNIQLRRLGVPNALLPEHKIVIWDEAHAAADICREFFGDRITLGSIRTAVEDLTAKDHARQIGVPANIAPDLKKSVENIARDYFKELLDLKLSKNYVARIERPGQVDGQRLKQALDSVAELYKKIAGISDVPEEARERLFKKAILCGRQSYTIDGARTLKDDDLIFFIDVHEGGRGGKNISAQLVKQPLYPSKILAPEFFDSPLPPQAKILCSATLTTSSKTNPFGFVAKELGITQKGIIECVAESPFDYTKAAFIALKGFPHPSKEPDKYNSMAAEAMVQTVKRSRGRLLGLYTSYKALDVAHKRLLSENLPYRILRQGEAPRSQLIKQFKEDEESVLIGTDSFWTGVDVPGDSCVAVFIDKLPFDNANDPVLNAIQQYETDWFPKYYVPKALVKFKQGFGRLIRSVKDRGVVVCPDSRIITSPKFGKRFRDCIPTDCVIVHKLDSIEDYCWPEK